jgi:hypothetical protein
MVNAIATANATLEARNPKVFGAIIAGSSRE